MINSIDLIFILMTIIFIVTSILRGAVACVVSAVRFFIIVPAAFFVSDYILPIISKDMSAPALVIKAVSVVISFVVLLILSSLLMLLLKKLQRKKGMPLRHTNALLGGVFGLAKSLVIIISTSTLAHMVAPVLQPNSSVASLIGTSEIINYVNTINPFVM